MYFLFIIIEFNARNEDKFFQVALKLQVHAIVICNLSIANKRNKQKRE